MLFVGDALKKSLLVPDLVSAVTIMELWNSKETSSKLHVPNDIDFTYEELHGIFKSQLKQSFKAPELDSTIYRLAQKGGIAEETVEGKFLRLTDTGFIVYLTVGGIDFEFCGVSVDKCGIVNYIFPNNQSIFLSKKQAVRYEATSLYNEK